MNKDAEAPKQNRAEQIRQHAFRTSEEGVHTLARLGGAIISIDSGERTIGAATPALITPESDPRLFKAYKAWSARKNPQS